MNKLVFISQRVDDYPQRNERRDALDQSWFSFLNTVGVLPVPVPNSPEIVTAMLERLCLSGIVLTGGNSPISYGGDAPERDATDNMLIEYAIKHSLPLVGVCRGMQSIVLYFGGTLKEISGHIAVRHKIRGDVDREVNSYHSLAPDNLPECLQAVSESDDKVIEELRHKSLPIYAMMSHPEREHPYAKQDIDYFRRILR